MAIDDSVVLEIEELGVTHGGRGLRSGSTGTVAVDGVDLVVNRSEVVGLVGESGSGKSTLARAVTGLGAITSGRVRIHGRDVGDLRRDRDLRADVQMVFQDPHGSLDPRQNVRSGLAELRRLHPRRTSWIDDEELMGRVGLQTGILAHLPHEISGGQAQRVSIARALLLQPRLLVADEPTSGLDVSVQAQIVNLLLGLRDTDEIAVLFISHDLAVVRHTCDRTLVMKDGRIVEQGPTLELLDRPTDPYTRRLVAAIPGHRQRGGDPVTARPSTAPEVA